MRLKIPILLVALALCCACARKPQADTSAERDRKFEQMMNGVTLVGQSTRSGHEGLSGEERYAIDRVSKVNGDTWLFQSRMKVGPKEIPVPIPITILWAGDTPVITLTNFAIPGMGSYTARILLYGDQYAGTWSGKEHGGQMFGKIVRP